MEVHDNVVLESNTAANAGGAVSLLFKNDSQPPGVVFCNRGLPG